MRKLLVLASILSIVLGIAFVAPRAEARPLLTEMPASCLPVTITGTGLFGYSQHYGETRYTTFYPKANCPENDGFYNFGVAVFEGNDTNLTAIQFWDDRYLPESQLGCVPGATIYNTGYYCNGYTYWHTNFNPYITTSYTVKSEAPCTYGTYKTLSRYFKLYWNAGTVGSPVWQLKATQSGNYYHICDTSGR